MSGSQAGTSRELRVLLRALCEGELDQAGHARIEQLVRGRPEAIDFFLSYCWLHGELRWQTSPSAVDPHDRAKREAGPMPPASPLLGFLSTLVPDRLVGRSNLFWVAAIAINAIAVFLMALALSPKLRRGLDSAAAGSKRPTATSGQSGQTQTVGKLLASPNARWDKRRSPSAEGGVQFGQRYELAAGWAKIELTRGTALAIEAPAIWRLEAEGRLQLEAGKLFAHVSPAGIGFTVATPAGEVVDLGTDFGVVVAGGRTEVHVIQGKVEVKPSRAGGAGAAGSIKLSAGNAVRIENRGTGFSPIVLDRAGFAALLQNSNAKGTAGSLPGVDLTGVPTESVTFQDGVAGYSGTQDTFIYGPIPDSNHGAVDSVSVFERETATTNYSRGLIRFDLSSVPPGTLVAGATLTLCQHAAQGAPGVSNSLYVVAAPDKDWTETGATWNSSYGSTAWTGGPGLVAGDDYDPIPVATAETPIAAGAPMTFALSAAGVASIQHWVNHPADNSGFFLRQADSSNSIDLFWSREATEVSLRPALALTLITP